MENNPRSGPGPDLGPAPALPSPGRPVLSRSRASLLEVLRAQTEPTPLAALLPLAGLHENTVREHLEALEEQGHVRRHRAAPSGRGRPAWLYTATSSGPDTGRSEYAGLAAALASAIHRTSRSPGRDATEAGVEWGRELVREREPAEPQAVADTVVEMLDHLGFGPEEASAPGEGAVDVRLTRCPLLTAAHRYPDVVCGVHLGIVQGAIDELGGDPAGTELSPFAEPGACRLRLPAVNAEGR